MIPLILAEKKAELTTNEFDACVQTTDENNFGG